MKTVNMKTVNMKTLTKQKGFTLIELVVVIVILGILAVTAAPKFIDLQDDARTATLEAVKASMQSAATLVHSKALIAGKSETAGQSVKVNGNDLNIEFGYPEATTTAWDALLELDSNEFDSVVISGSPDTIVVYSKAVYPSTAPTATTDKCIVHSAELTAVGTPTFTVVNCE